MTGEDNDEERVRSCDAWRNAEEEFLAEYGLSQNQLAKAIGISPNRITEIVNNRRRITADTALRLSLYFGNSPEFWMNLQSHYDLKITQRSKARRYQTHKSTTGRLIVEATRFQSIFEETLSERRWREKMKRPTREIVLERADAPLWPCGCKLHV